MKALRKKRFLLFGLILSACFGHGLNDTVYFDDLLNSSNLRYADFLQYSTNVDVTSTDFYCWRISINNLANYRDNGWDLYLDDHLIKPLVYGEQSLNQFSFSNLSVDSIEIIGHPGLIGGNYTGQGAIRIHTARPGRGFSTSGNILLANESGDPGPYKYTERSSPNVDKIGHDNSAILEYGFRSGWIRLALNSQQHTYTDTAICPRIRRTTEDWPGANKIAGALDIRYEGKHWNHSFFSSWSSNQPAFLFIDIFQQEFPLQFHHFQSSYSGNRKNVLQWYMDYNRNDIRRCAKALHSLEPYIHHSLDLRAETVVNFANPLRIAYRLNSNQYDFSGDYPDYNFLCHQINGELKLDRLSGVSKIMTALVYFQNRLATNLSFQSSRVVGRNGTFYSHLSMSQRHLNLSPYFQFWQGPGERIIRKFEVTLSDFPEYYSLYSGSFGLQRQIFKEILTDLNLYLNYRTAEWWYRTAGQSEHWREGAYGGLGIAIVTPRGRRMEGNFSAKFRISNDDPFNEQPAVKVVYRLTFRPDRNFTLFLNGVYQSDEHWDWADNDAEIVIPLMLPARVWFESGFNKWCWQRRLLVRVAIQNLTNSRLQYHPLGMNREMSMIAGVYFWLKER